MNAVDGTKMKQSCLGRKCVIGRATIDFVSKITDLSICEAQTIADNLKHK